MDPIPPHAPRALPAMLGRRAQVAFVVADMDAALRHWTEGLGVGPFVVFDTAVGDRLYVHRGRVSPVEFAIAFAYLGDLQVELIRQTAPAPSPYQEFLEAGREGLHHLGFWPEDFAAACAGLERAGYREASAICLRDGTKNAVYYESPDPVGTMVELVPMTADRARTFGAIKALADGWDGSRPVRRHASRAAFLASDDFRPGP